MTRRRCVRFALCLAPWLVVLAVPALRMLLRVQIMGSEYAPVQAFTPLPDITLFGINLKPLPPTRRELAARFPDNAAVQIKAPEKKGDWGIELQEGLRRYDRLLERRPRDLWLLSNRLRIGVLALEDGRVAGDFEKAPRGGGVPGIYSDYATPWWRGPLPIAGVGSPDEDEFYGVYRPSSSTTEPPRKNFTSAQLKHLIALAERGRRLEPDNCYFDWVLACFLFAARRDADALDVLHAGTRKPRFDSHLKDDMREAIGVAELARPLLIEERIGVATSQYLDNSDKYRHVTHLALWPGVRAESAGDHARALTIYSDVARIGARMQDGEALHDEAIEGLRLQLKAWAGWKRRLPGGSWQGNMPDATVIQYARNFAAYATRHGRSDLAREAIHQGRSAAWLNAYYTRHQADRFWGMPPATLIPVALVTNACGAILVQMQLTAFVWLGLSFLMWRRMRWLWRFAGWLWHWISWLWRPAQGRSREDSCEEAPPQVQPHTRRDVWKSVAFSGLIVTVAFVAALWLGVERTEWFPRYDYRGGIKETIFVLGVFLYVVGSLATGLVWCGAAMLWRHRPLRGRPHFAFAPVPALRIPPSGIPPLAAFFTWSLTAYALVAWFLFWATYHLAGHWFWLVLLDFLSVSLSDVRVSDEVVPMLLSALALLGWVCKWIWQMPPRQRLAAGKTGLLWYRQTLRAWLTIGGVAYLVLALASLPLRRAADADFAAFLRHGEIAAPRTAR